MKVYNLQCPHGHGFEGWFGSEADYLDQQARALLTCPVCGSAEVQRLPSAPRLNLLDTTRVTRAPEPAAAKPASAPVAVGDPRASAASAATPSDGPDAAAQVAFLQAVRHVLAHTEDVGSRFADEARRIHHGDVEARPIRGQASAEQRRELLDEGIEVHSLPVPAGLDKPLQ
ncbi:MAG: DUF1178 family protein [Leptothrix sp. (in: b-proteobacteria)]